MRKVSKYFLAIFAFSLLFLACENDDLDGDFTETGTNRTKTLATPANFTAVYNPETNQTEFSWDSVPNATGYSILESGKNQSLTAVKIVSNTETNATVIGYPSSVATYYYWLLAYNDSEESYLTEPESIQNYCISPDDVTGSCSNGVVQLSWTAVPASSGYKVYYKKSTEEDFQEFSNTVTSAGATITLRQYTESFDYKVKAFKGNTLASEFSNTCTVSVDLFSPKNFKAETTDEYGKVKLSWDSIGGIDGYKIYYGTNASFDSASETRAIDSANTSSCEISDLSKGTYYFFIKSVKGSGESSSYTASESVRIKIWYPSNITVSARTTSSLTLTYDSVEDANLYKFTVTDENGTSVTTANVSDTTKTISGLSSGTVYNIQIQCVESDGTEGEISGVVQGKTQITSPVINSSYTIFRSTTALVYWNNVTGASYYEVRYSTENNVDSAISINRIIDNYAELSGLTPEVKYYYWVKAIDEDNEDYQTDWVTGSATTVIRPTNFSISKSGTSYNISWNYGGDTTTFKILCYKCSELPDSISTDDAVTVATTTATTHDVSNLINDRDDNYTYYIFSVFAYCELDDTWYQGSTSDDYAWVYYDETFPYGESNQLPTSKTAISPRNTYSNYGYTQSYAYTTAKYYYFKATRGKTYTIYIADKYKNTSASFTYTKGYVQWKWYDAGNSSSQSYSSTNTYSSFTASFDSYIVIDIKKPSSDSSSGWYGIQIVEN